MLYDILFRKLERARWSLDRDVRWEALDREAIGAEELHHIRQNCLTELSALYAEEMFIRDFYDDIDFCQFMSIWYYEEMKHCLVLKEYLKRFGLEPGEEEMRRQRQSFAPADWRQTLALHFVGEHRLGTWYQRWSEHFREPVIRQIYGLIAADEFRHADCYFRFMQKAIEREREALLPFIETCLFMLRNPRGDKHPTSLRVNGRQQPSVLERLDDPEYVRRMLKKTIGEEDEGRLARRVLNLLGRLAGRRLNDRADAVRLVRELRALQAV